MGMVLNGKLSMADHMNSLCRSCYYQLAQILGSWCNLSLSAAVTFVHLLFIKHLEYCNSILPAFLKFRILQLQSVLNYSAQLHV